MRGRLPLFVVVALLVAACGNDNDALSQPATEEGAIEAAVALQEAALRADADGIRQGLSSECLDAIDDDEFRAALAFIGLFTAGMDLDQIEVHAEVEELEDGRAEVAIEYLDPDGQPLPDDGDGFSLNAEDMTLVHNGTRWVADDCQFGGTGGSGARRCLDSSGELTDCPDPAVAGRDDPVPLGASAYIGAGWTMRLANVDLDAIATIEAESGYSSDLDAGIQAVLIDLEMAYVGDDEPANAFSVSMGGVGGSNVAVDTFGCGFLPEAIDGSSSAFTGGVIRGQVCLPTPMDDIDSVLLYTEVPGGDQIFFDLQGQPVDSTVPSARGPVAGSRYEQQRQTPEPVGVATDAGEWTVTVTDVDLDATEAVLAANDFIDPPDPGRRYVVIGYSAQFDGDEPANSNDVRPDLVTQANLTIFASCSSTLDGAFDSYAEVFPGGQLSGTLCYEVPDDEVEGLLAMVQPDFFADDITFLALR